MTESGERPALPAEASGDAESRARLQGRRVVVIGAGTEARSGEMVEPLGNGRAIAVLAGREGANVACVDIDETSCRRTAQLVELEGVRGLPLVADVTDPRACERVIDEAVDLLGGIDGLVLNVGTNRGTWLNGTEPELWDRLLSLNLRSHFLIVRAALRRMSAVGSIVFIGSGAGLIPGSRSPAYDASKSALEGLCRHVAFEGSRLNVRANLVVPGMVDTPLGREMAASRPTRSKVFLPLGRQGTPWEIAYGTIFLLSGESSYITGQMLVIDGGVTWMR